MSEETIVLPRSGLVLHAKRFIFVANDPSGTWRAGIRDDPAQFGPVKSDGLWTVWINGLTMHRGSLAECIEYLDASALALRSVLWPTAEAELARVTASKDAAYAERDKVVAGFVTCAHALGWSCWLATHVGEWEDDWRNIVFVETPYGQMSWHYHDSERDWFSWIGLVQPRDPKPWDGHSTPEKYERLHGMVHDGASNNAAVQYRRLLGHALRMTSEAKDWIATVGCESDAPGDSTCIDMGVDPCGPCKIGQAAEELESLLRGEAEGPELARLRAVAEAAEAKMKRLDAAFRRLPQEIADIGDCEELSPDDGNAVLTACVNCAGFAIENFDYDEKRAALDAGKGAK